MKGLMALLLTFIMTGMVSGQQSQQNTNQFGGSSSNSTGRLSNQYPDNSSASNGSSRSPADNQNVPTSSTRPGAVPQSGPLEMELDDGFIQQFIQRGQLMAVIEPREHVNEIVFLYKDRNGHSNAGATTGLMQPVAKENETLVFELDDRDLERIKQSGLKYKYDVFEKGRFETVKVFYKRPAPSQPTSQRPDSRQFTSTPSPSPDYTREYDYAYMGPTMENSNSSQQRPPSRETAAQGEFQQQYPSSNQSQWSPSPKTGNQAASRSNNFSTPANPNQHDHSSHQHFANEQNESNSEFSSRQTFNDTGSSNTNRGLMPIPPRREYRSENQQTQNQNFQQPYGQNQASQNQSSQNLSQNTDFQNQSKWGNSQIFTGQPNNNLEQDQTNQNSNARPLTENDRIQQELYRRKALAREQQLYLEHQELLALEQENAMKEQTLRNQQRQLELDRLRGGIAGNGSNSLSDTSSVGGTNYSNGGPTRVADNRGSNYRDQLTGGFNSQQNIRGGNSLAPQTTGPDDFRQNYKTVIPGPNDMPNKQGNDTGNDPNFDQNAVDRNRQRTNSELLAASQERGTEKLIYFMLLFSLALNVYLGWISRGFYVRYNELADELRETFTASM